jgi:regulator of replication initiation timing
MAITKTVDGKPYPAGAWLYVPDRTKPSTWKLRYKELIEGKYQVTAKILGMAMAALTKGFRGSRVQIPDAKRKSLITRVKGMQSSLGNQKTEQAEIPVESEAITEQQEIFDTFEEVSFSPGSVEVDRDAGILKNIALLGLKSKNGRVYSKSAVKSAISKGIYEGLSCFKNHNGGKSRGLDEVIGNWKNVTWDETSGKVRGDLHTLKAHREMVFDFYDNGPELAAPSHVVEGKVSREKQKDGSVIEHVKEITKGISVDLVVGAATVNSLRESGNENQEVKKVTKENISDNEVKNYMEEGSEITALTEQVGKLTEKIDKLQEENERLKSEREHAEKLAGSRSLLKEALAKTDWKQEARDLIYKQNENTIMTEAEVNTLVETVCEFMKLAGAKLSEVKVDIPTDDAETGKKKLTLSEAFLKRNGYETDKK